MNPWQRGRKAPERSPLARAVGKRPLGRPRRSGSSQLVVAVENNKRGRREPPAFFFVPPQLHRLDRASPNPQAARGALPAVSRSGAGPHMYAQNAGVGSSRFPFEITMPTGSTLILSSLCPSFFAAIDLPSLIDPRHARGNGLQSSVCATFAEWHQLAVRQALGQKKDPRHGSPSTRNDTPPETRFVSKRYATSFLARKVSPVYPIPNPPRSTVMCQPR